MRILLILQGAPGSGKSTLVERGGLGPWTVSSDTVRLLFRGPELRPSGVMTIAATAEGLVWRTIHAAIEQRMRAGDLTVIDATHTRLSEIEPYCEMAQRYGYQAHIVTWRDLPVETCVERNASRSPMRRVPEAVVREMHRRLATFEPPEGIAMATPEDLPALVRERVVDADADGYERVRIVSGATVAEPRPGELVVVIAGGEAARIKNDVVRCSEALILNWRGKRVLVSRGGLSGMPEPGRLAFVPSLQLEAGVGGADFDVDAAFAAAAEANAVQVHGGRGLKGLVGRSVGLLGEGGIVRSVLLQDDGAMEFV